MSSYTRSSINSPPSPSSRRGGGVLLNEPSVGLDTVYDGAHQMMSTEYLYGPKGGRWSTGQAYLPRVLQPMEAERVWVSLKTS